MPYDYEMAPVLRLFDNITPRTWTRAERKRFFRQISMVSGLATTLSDAISNEHVSSSTTDITARVQQCVPRSWWQRVVGSRHTVDYDSVAFAVSRIAHQGSGVWDEYPSDGVFEHHWDRFYGSILRVQIAGEEQPLETMDVINIAQYHKDAVEEQLTTTTDTATPIELMFATNYTTITKRTGAVFLDVRHMKRAVFAILWWISTQGHLCSVLNMFTQYGDRASPEFLGRYGWDKVSVGFLFHVLMAFQQALRHSTLDPDTPWAWQEPLFVASVLTYVKDTSRLRSVCAGVHNVFEARVDALRERR